MNLSSNLKLFKIFGRDEKLPREVQRTIKFSDTLLKNYKRWSKTLNIKVVGNDIPPNFTIPRPRRNPTNGLDTQTL